MNLLHDYFRVIGVPPADKAEEQGVAIGFLPFFHIYGLMLLSIMLTCGKKYVIVSGFQPNVFLGLIQKHKVQACYKMIMNFRYACYENAFFSDIQGLQRREK